MILYYNMRVIPLYMRDDGDGSAYYIHKDRLGYTLARSSEKRLNDIPIYLRTRRKKIGTNAA